MEIKHFFKFLTEKEGRDLPFKIKLIYFPERITKDELNVMGNLDLRHTPISEKYTKEEIRKMCPGVKGGIFLYIVNLF